MAQLEGFSLNKSFGFAVNRTALRLTHALTRALAPHDVTPQQWAVINRLWEQEGVSQQQLADLTFRDPPNTARILDRLQHKGLIIREPDPTDRRVQLIFLTEQGRRLRSMLIPLAEQLLDRALEGLTHEERERTICILNRVDRNLE